LLKIIHFFTSFLILTNFPKILKIYISSISPKIFCKKTNVSFLGTIFSFIITSGRIIGFAAGNLLSFNKV